MQAFLKDSSSNPLFLDLHESISTERQIKEGFGVDVVALQRKLVTKVLLQETTSTPNRSFKILFFVWLLTDGPREIFLERETHKGTFKVPEWNLILSKKKNFKCRYILPKE